MFLDELADAGRSHGAPHVDFLASTPEWEHLLESRPNIVAWHGRVQALPCMQGTTWPRVTAMAQVAA